MKESLAGKVALVTGGNSGIGLATAKHFVTEGAIVFITGRRQEPLYRAVDLKDRGIRVNIVSPGVVPTPGYDALGLTSEALAPSLPRIPLGRVGTTDEIAQAIAFLASDDSSYITGAELFVDGGMTQV